MGGIFYGVVKGTAMKSVIAPSPHSLVSSWMMPYHKKFSCRLSTMQVTMNARYRVKKHRQLTLVSVGELFYPTLS